MAISSKVGTFLIQSTDTVSTVIQIRSVGFQPKAVIFFWSGRTESTDTAGRANHDKGFGIATGTANRACQCTHSDDVVAAAQANSGTSGVACIGTITHLAAPGVDGLADFNGFASDGFDIIIDDQFGHNVRVSYLALGGDSITNATVNTFAFATATGNFNITNAGFQPDFVLLGMGAGATLEVFTVAASQVGIGAAISSTARMGVCGAGADDVATMITRRYALDIEVLGGLSTGLNLTHRADFVAMLSNGFTLNALEVDATAVQCFYLALQGGNYAVGSLLTKTDTTDIAVTGLGFTPSGVLLCSHGKAEDAQNSEANDDIFTMGAFTSPTERVTHGISDQNGAADSVVGTAVEYDEAYVNLDNTGAVVGLMDCKSVDVGGFTLVMDDTDPSAAFVGYVAFGPAAVTGGSLMGAIIM